MLIGIAVLILAAIVAINVFLWKSGFLMEAERPEVVADRPLKDPRVRNALLKRLKRWREEGKLTRAEYERIEALCQREWDTPDD